MNQKTLKALVEAGAVKKIRLTAEGSLIYIEASVGNDITSAKTTKGKLKTWSTLDSAAKWARSLGIGEMQLEVSKWRPNQTKLRL